ncbi:phosphonate ABC transporter ATP-binding protein, partial [Streptococcus suis]
EDALRQGNRLIVMKNGQIIQDQNAEAKSKMKLEDYYKFFD